MGEGVFQILRKAQGVAFGGEQREDGVESVLRADGRSIGHGEPFQQTRGDVEGAIACPVIAQGEGVAAAPAEGVIVGQQPMAPDGGACARARGHGVEADIVRTPDGLKFGAIALD